MINKLFSRKKSTSNTPATKKTTTKTQIPRPRSALASRIVNISPARPVAGKSTSRKPIAPKNTQTNTTNKDRNLVNDTIWLFVLVVAIYLALCLLGFVMRDPSWSRSIPHSEQVVNFGGLLGAYLSDIAYYLFGLSVWWCIVALGMWLYRNFRPILDAGTPPYNSFIASSGLGILLLCSPVLESLVLHDFLKNSLPFGAGGFVGSLMAKGLSHLLGTTGSVLFLFIISLLALSLIIQISWLDFLEKLGCQLEYFFKNLFQTPTPSSSHPVTPLPEKTITTPHIQKETTDNKSDEAIIVPAASISNRKRALSITTPTVSSRTFSENPKTSQTPLSQSGTYCLPNLSILKYPKKQTINIDTQQLHATAQHIETKLAEFGISVEVVSATAGPVITRYEIEPAKGIKGSQIVNLAKDLARSLAVQHVRVVETIEGKHTMGIELPNEQRQYVSLQEIFTSDVFTQASSKLTLALGKDIAGSPVVGDLAKMPHLLVGGMTDSGKSVGIHAMIMSMLYKATPDEVRFIMIDPKMLELSVYQGIAHLLCPVVTDMKEAGNALNWCVAEMEKRYRLLSHVGVRNLASYNEKIQFAQNSGKPIPNPFSQNPDEPEPLEKLAQIVVIIDELADLMMTEKKAVETQIARLAQKARAAGIHMIIATQRPSVDVITGLIKANIPTRIAFTVQSRIDSRTILDQMGAESLLKYGDLLFLQPGSAEPIRLQGAFVSEEEVHRVVTFIKSQSPSHYIDGILSGEATSKTHQIIHPESNNNHDDELFDQAVQFVLSTRKTSISSLQRQLRIGYNRAANLMQALEDEGIVSTASVDGKRQILVHHHHPI